MSNFENYFKAFPNFSAQAQDMGRIFLDATTSIAKEQQAAAETAIDYGMKAFRLPEGGEATDLVAERIAQSREFVEAMGESAERILSIASEAGNKAVTAWVETAEAATDEAAA